MPIPIAIILALTAVTPAAAATDKVAIIDFTTPGLPAAEGKALSDSLVGVVAAEIARLGHNVVSSADINAMLSLEKQKELIGCSEASCLAEIGGALGVDLMVSGAVGKLGDTFTMTMTLVNPQRAEVKQRFQGTAGTEAALGATARRGVAVLFGRATDLSGAGIIAVQTEPPGGTVFLDGKAVGAEPIILDNVIAGDHIVSASKGTLVGKQSILMAAGAVERITIPLKSAATVKVKVFSSPINARVLIDGREVGKTPVVVSNVECGKRDVRVELDNHVPYEQVHDFSFAEFEKNGEEPLKVDADLTRQLHLPVPIILLAGATTSANYSMAKGLTAQLEAGIGGRWFEATVGWVRPDGLMVTARSFVLHWGVDGALVARYVWASGLGYALASGLSLGKGLDCALGVVGVRLEALASRSFGDSPTTNFPIALVGYWRL